MGRRALFVGTLFLLLLAPLLVFAQEQTVITGTVTDEAGTPLVGANVFIVGTGLGAATDVEGKYRFVVPAAMVQGQEVELKASYIGYRSKTERIVLVAGTITRDFALAVDVLKLEEVVVTGMGVGIQKEKLGVTIGKVRAREVVESDESNVIAALHGKVANVEVTASSGEPGAETYLRIRGANTIQGSNQPLIVVDGSPINNQSIAGAVGRHGGVTQMNRATDINPDDIESIEILKGAAASAIYGSRAGAGVVLITTKSGRPGRPRLSYKMTYTFDEVNRSVPLQKSYGQGLNGEASTTYPWSWGPKLDPDTPTYDHAWEIFETGHVLENNLTLSGGTERTTYFLSLERYNVDGTIKGKSDYIRNSIRLKASQRVSDKLNVTGNIAFADVSSNRIQKGSNVSGLLLGAFRTPPNFNNQPYLDPVTGLHRSYRYQQPTELFRSRGYDNPFFVINEHVNTADIGRAFGNLKVEYDPFPWLNISYTLGHDYSNDERRTVLPPSSSSYPNGRVIREKFTYAETDGYLAISATRSFAPANLNLNLLLGHQWNQRSYNAFQTIGDGMSVVGFNQLDNTSSWSPNETESVVRDESFFGQLMVDLWDQLFLSGKIRNDGSSTFGEAQKRHWYPNISGAWEFTRLKPLSGLRKWLSYGKIRAAYGEAGRQPGAYQTITAFSPASYGAGWGVFLDATAFGFGGFETSFTKGNKDIRPERAKEWEAGIELAFLNNRVGLDVTRYVSKTEDVILSLPLPRSTGFGAQLRNAATIENDGWEVGLTLQPVSRKNFKWDMRLLYAQNDNLVTDLAGAEFVGLGGFVSCAAYAVEGYPYGVLRGEDFVRFGRGSIVDIHDEEGNVVEENVNIDERFTGWKEGDLFIDGDGYPVLDPQERVIGDPNPDWTGSIRNTFTLFNKIRLSALIDIKQGGDVWNGTKGALYFFGTHKDTEDREGTQVFEGVGPGAGKPVPKGQAWHLNNLGSGFTGPASQFIEDGSFVKLREISLSYKLRHPSLTKWTGLSDIDIRLSARNLKTWTDYTGIDPETNLAGNTNWRGLDYFNNPQTRSYVLTLRFNY
jgi:TonB-linked SusC/RagA family outer membrane protein